MFCADSKNNRQAAKGLPALSKMLAQIPCARDVKLRDHHKGGEDNFASGTDLYNDENFTDVVQTCHRLYIHQSILLQSRAELGYDKKKGIECINCKANNGYFRRCRVSAGFKWGVCVNCYVGGSGVQGCSFVPGKKCTERMEAVQNPDTVVQKISRRRIGVRTKSRAKSVGLVVTTMTKLMGPVHISAKRCRPILTVYSCIDSAQESEGAVRRWKFRTKARPPCINPCASCANSCSFRIIHCRVNHHQCANWFGHQCNLQ